MGYDGKRNIIVPTLGGGYVNLQSPPIISSRTPKTSDAGELGQLWVYTTGSACYVLTNVTNGSYTWTNVTSSTTGTFATLSVTGDSELQGKLTVSDASETHVISGGVQIGKDVLISGDLTVTGDTQLNGNFDYSTNDLLSFTSTLDGAPSIYVHANGGTSEQVKIHSDQGTGLSSILLLSDVGGIKLSTAMANAESISLSSSNGGIKASSALTTAISSSKAGADAITISATAGGIDFTVGGNYDLDLINSGGGAVNISSVKDGLGIYMHANGGTSEQIKLHADQGNTDSSVYLLSDDGGILLESTGKASDDAIKALSTAGGVHLSGAMQLLLETSETSADSIRLSSGGGVDVLATGGAGLDIDIANTGGSVNLSSGESVADAIVIEASDAAGGVKIKAGSAGIDVGSEADTALIGIGDVSPSASRTITISGGQNNTDSIVDTLDLLPDGVDSFATAIKVANIACGNITLGENNVNIATGSIASGKQQVKILSGAYTGGTKTLEIGEVNLQTSLDGALAINNNVNANVSINSGTSTGTVAIGSANAGAISVDSGSGISLDGGGASNFSVSGAGNDLTLSSAAGTVIISGGEDVADAIYLHVNNGTTESIRIHSEQGTGDESVKLLSDAGGVYFDAKKKIQLVGQNATADAVRIYASDAAGGIDVDCGTGGFDLTSTGVVNITGAAASTFSLSSGDFTLSTVNSLVLSSSESATDAIYLHTTDASGGIYIDSDAGLVTMSSKTNSAVWDNGTKTASGTINANVGCLEVTSFILASATQGTITITNSKVTVNSEMHVTLSDDSTSDARITLEGVQKASGSFKVFIKNNGSASANGTTFRVCFWVTK